MYLVLVDRQFVVGLDTLLWPQAEGPQSQMKAQGREIDSKGRSRMEVPA